MILYRSGSKYFGESTAKRYTIHCPIIDTVTLLYIQQHPSVLETATIAKSWRAAAGFWSFAALQKPYQKAYRRDREQSPKIHAIVRLLIHLNATFGRL